MKFTDHYFRRDANRTGIKDKETDGKESISSEDYIAQVEVEGVTYVFDANQVPPPAWQMNFYEQKSRRMVFPAGTTLGNGDNNKVIKELVKLVKEWIDIKMPETFYMNGSLNEEVYTNIADALKKGIKKGYNVIDEREEVKDDRIDGGVLREGNPLGRIIFTLHPVSEASELNIGEMDDGTKLGELEPTYENPEDVKLDKSHTTYKKSDKLDKGV